MRLKFHPAVERLESHTLLSGIGPAAATNGPWAVALNTDQPTYQVGQPVKLTFTETNTSGHVASLGDGPSIDGFVVTQAGKTVWQSNAGIQPNVIWDMMVFPGGVIHHSAVWDGHPDDPSGVEQTGVTLTGTFQVYNQMDPSAKATFTMAPTTPVKPTPPPLSVSVATNPSSSRAGQPVVITITETNNGTSPVSVLTGARILSGTVTGPHGQVWVFHDLRAMATGRGLLQPGHSRTFTLVWNGLPDVAGASVLPGNYKVRAGVDGVSGTATIRVVS